MVNKNLILLLFSKVKLVFKNTTPFAFSLKFKLLTFLFPQISRISKHDLRIRPIFHCLQRRIEAHIFIAFTAYNLYKELERQFLKVKFFLFLYIKHSK
jgi:hypothetical protein